MSKYLESMVLQECYTLEHTLSDLEKFSSNDISSICEELLFEADALGLVGCFLKFRSNMEPYGDYLGYPSVIPCGYREKNDSELAEDARNKRIQAIALKRKITWFEATQLAMLEDRGVTFGTTPEQSD